MTTVSLSFGEREATSGSQHCLEVAITHPCKRERHELNSCLTPCYSYLGDFIECGMPSIPHAEFVEWNPALLSCVRYCSLYCTEDELRLNSSRLSSNTDGDELGGASIAMHIMYNGGTK
jgi:hypothetical protein